MIKKVAGRTAAAAKTGTLQQFACVRIRVRLCVRNLQKHGKSAKNRENNKPCNFKKLASDEEFVKLWGYDS